MSSAPQGPYRVEGSEAFGWRVMSDAGSVGRLWSLQSHAQNARDAANMGYHEGRESVMAERGDLLRTDNSAVVARLSAENERLQAEVAKLKAE